jgi:HD-GYP domain-containing protein (c-di-GMP phosphodiesterase class II)
MLREADDEMYRQKLSSSQSARSGIVQAIMKMLEMRDFETEQHSQRLDRLALELAQRADLPGHRRNDLRLLAQFHDIGKIGVPDKVLLKPGPLSPEESKEMERHSEIGHRIATVIPELQPIAEFILKHHERWDGKGYPMGLKGEQIPLEDRILSIVDAFDAMTSDRPYRKAMTADEAFAELRKCQGIQFDPILVELFLAMSTEVENFTAEA